MLDMGMSGHMGENFPKAQAIKDATMAHFILKNYQAGQLFLHLNGSYHSDNYEGILWYLQQQKPHLKVVTLSSVYQPTIRELLPDNKGKADFILAVPESMTKTYQIVVQIINLSSYIINHKSIQDGFMIDDL